MNDEYAVSDLGTASYLLTIGNKLLRLDRTNPHRVVFYFARTSHIETAVEQYWNGTARVPPLVLQMNQKALKTRLLAEQP